MTALPEIGRAHVIHIGVSVELMSSRFSDTVERNLLLDVFGALSFVDFRHLVRLAIFFMEDDELPSVGPYVTIDAPASVFGFNHSFKPPLEELYLMRYHLPLESHIFSASLRVLSLVNVRCWETYNDLLDCLRRTPNLEILYYHTTGEGDGSEDLTLGLNLSRQTSHSVVHLPRLRELYVGSRLLLAIAAYALLDIPSSTMVDLYGGSDEQMVPELNNAISRHCAVYETALRRQFGSDGLPFKMVSIWFCSLRGFTLTAMDALSAQDPRREHTLPRGGFNLTTHFLLHGSPSFMDVCLSLPTFNQCTTVGIHGSMEQSIFETLYRKFPALEQFDLMKPNDVESFVHMLSIEPSLRRPLRVFCQESCEFDKDSSLLKTLVDAMCSLASSTVLDLSACTLESELLLYAHNMLGSDHLMFTPTVENSASH